MNNLLCPILLVTGGVLLSAQEPRAIVAEVQKRASVSSQQYEGVLQVIDANGRTSEKRWSYTRIGSFGESKVVIRFTTPAEVKGVAVLVVNYPDRSSDQWMWTPAINRERRVASQDRRTRFFGTDFSFEDLEERDLDHYQYSLLGEETLDGEPCWKIGATPTAGKKSQYTNSTYWIRKSTHTYAQIENFDQSQLIRRLKYQEMKNIQGVWTAQVLEVEDVGRKSRTILKLDSVKYNVPLTPDQFTIPALRRG